MRPVGRTSARPRHGEPDGPDATRLQILLYTLVLVPCGFAPVLLGFGVLSLSGAWLQWMSEPANAEEAITMRVLALFAGVSPKSSAYGNNLGLRAAGFSGGATPARSSRRSRQPPRARRRYR